MREFDTRPLGRCWTAEEMASRHEELPGRLEMAYGKLCLDEEQRLVLLGVLLEHVGTERAVSLGSLDAWKAAISRREEESQRPGKSEPPDMQDQFTRAAQLGEDKHPHG